MPILGIDNQTENWRTTRAFAPFLANAEARLRLAHHLSDSIEPDALCTPEQVELELFWNGVRDHLVMLGGTRDTPSRRAQFKEIYEKKFSSLWSDLEEYGFKLHKPVNYNVSEEAGITKLYHHLHGAEVDVVLQTPGHVFVGEAKYKGGFNDYGNAVLRHQLVRLYVVSSMLLEILAEDRGKEEVAIVPFVVSDEPEKLERSQQAQFMIHKGWLSPKNVMGWESISRLVHA